MHEDWKAVMPIHRCVPFSKASCCGQAVSELLSQHVLQNYDKFVAGIDEVIRVETDLVAAHKTAKVTAITCTAVFGPRHSKLHMI